MSRLRIKTNGQRANCRFPTKGNLGTRTRRIARFGTCVGQRSSIFFYDFLSNSLLFGSSASGHFRLSSRPQRAAAWRAEMEAKTDGHGLSDWRLALLPSPT